MKKIDKGKKILIIFDIHQNIGEYVEPILEREYFDHLIWGGDFFDTFKTPDNVIIYSISQTCEWINEKLEELGDRATWLIGNHDCAYLASYTKDHIKTRPNPYYFCSGWTKSKAKSINKHINPEFWNKLELCVQLGDNWIVSHAGFNYRHFQPFMSELDNIERLYNEWERDKHSFHLEPWHWIWDVGRSRGGAAIVGSCIWQDWGEFVPLDNVSQCVGHSTVSVPMLRIKKNGNRLKNYCLDCLQRVYGIWENNRLTVKDISGNVLNK